MDLFMAVGQNKRIYPIISNSNLFATDSICFYQNLIQCENC